MTDQNSSDNKSNEGPIARARRRSRELGQESLERANVEAEDLIKRLGREPNGVERKLIEHFAILDVRTRTLRKWGLHTEADTTTQLLMKSGSELNKILPSSTIILPLIAD